MEDCINKSFKNTGEAGDEVFRYLGDVRDSDVDPNQAYTADEDLPIDSDAARMPGNYRTGKLTTRIDHISSDKPAYAGHRDLGDFNIMPKPMQRKRANADNSGGWLSGLGKITLKGIEDIRRKVFLNNPLLESAVIGGAVGLGTYALAPTVSKILGEKPYSVDRRTGEILYMDPQERRSTSLWTGLGIAGLNWLRGVNFKSFNPSQLFTMPKRASMLGPIDYVPTQFALNAVTLDPNIPDYLKYNTLNALGTIDKPLISSTDMIDAGISSGISGSTGFPVGRIAAASVADALTAYGVGKLGGLSNPGRLALGVGALSAMGRIVSNSFNRD